MIRKIVSGVLVGFTFFNCISGLHRAVFKVEGQVAGSYLAGWTGSIRFVILVRVGSYYLFGLYHLLWRYAGVNEIFTICYSVTVSAVSSSLYMYLSKPGFPRSVYIIAWGVNIACVGSSRLLLRIAYYQYKTQNSRLSRVLIVGAGDAGAMIARELQHRYYESKKLVGFIDDDRGKYNRILFGVKVLGNRKAIRKIAELYDVQEIIIALPSVGGKHLHRIIDECKKTKCVVKTVPGIYELIDGKVSIQQVRKYDLNDLIGENRLNWISPDCRLF